MEEIRFTYHLLGSGVDADNVSYDTRSNVLPYQDGMVTFYLFIN